MCPPSNAGIGSRFRIPRFTDMSAVKSISTAIPDSVAFAYMDYGFTLQLLDERTSN